MMRFVFRLLFRGYEKLVDFSYRKQETYSISQMREHLNGYARAKRNKDKFGMREHLTRLSWIASEDLVDLL